MTDGRSTVGRLRYSRATSAFAALLALGLAAFPPRAALSADEILVPANVQATAVVRILEYDRGLKTWATGALTVAVVAKDPKAVAEFSKGMTGREVQGVPVKVVEHNFKDGEALGGWVDQNEVRLLYVAPDLAAQTAAVLSAATSRKIPTFTPTRAQFERGATLGLVVHDGRPRVLVNLPASKSAGMNLDPKLLELSEVIR